MLPVGYILCALGQAGEEVPEAFAQRNEERLRMHLGTVTSTASPGPTVSPGIDPAPRSKAIRATPAARRRAKQASVSLEEIAAALKVKGVVGEKDVDAYLEIDHG